MANESSVMTAQEAIAKAEQELSTSRYILECTRSPGMREIHDKRCAWLSVIVGLAKRIANGVTVQDWISVKERLPKKNEMVLVYCKDKTIRGLDVRHIGSCDNGFWFLKTQPGTESFPHPEWEVTHWMPLPEPPKEV